MRGHDKTVSMILAKIKPQTGISVGFGPGAEKEMSHDDELHAIAQELVDAVKCGDTRGVVDALRGAFLCLDSEPHVEGEHVNEMEEDEEEEGEEENGKSLFAKYFGGGPVRYAEGGTVKKPKTPEEYDDDILAPGKMGQNLLKSYTSGSPDAYDKIKSDPVAKKVFKSMASNAGSDDDIVTLRQMLRTPGSDYWKQVDAEKAKPHGRMKKTPEEYDDDILAPGRPGQNLLKSYTSGSPDAYAKIKADPVAKKVFDSMASDAGSDDDIVTLRQMLRTPGSDYWKQVDAEKAKPSVSKPGAARRSLR